MSVKYDFYETPRTAQNKNIKRYHARVVGEGTVGNEEMLHHFSQHNSGISQGALTHAIKDLGRYIAEMLSEGKNVHIDGIGYFTMTLDCPETCDPADHHAQSIRVKSVKFRPDKAFLHEVRERTTFVRATEKRKSKANSLDQIKSAIAEHLQGNTHLTRRDLQRLCGLTRNTATNRLKQLVAEGFLVNHGTPRYPMYVLAE